MEEGAREIGAAPFAVAGRDIEVEEGVPMGRLDLGAGQLHEFDAMVRHVAALLADRLALAVVQRREKIVEAAIAAILPVILTTGADQKATFGEGRGFLGGAEIDMQ